jgi:hypothetical protein
VHNLRHEKASATSWEGRKELDILLAFLRAGDVLMVTLSLVTFATGCGRRASRSLSAHSAEWHCVLTRVLCSWVTLLRLRLNGPAVTRRSVIRFSVAGEPW